MLATASSQAGPSTGSTYAQQRNTERTDLWSDILRSADRSSRGREQYRRKNLILLAEKHHGRTQLLDEVVRKPQQSQRGRKGKAAERKDVSKSLRLIMGYEILQVKEDGEEDSVPPTSIFYPPSSEDALVSLISSSLPPESFQDTAVMIVLDWSKPGSMVKELVHWLRWVDQWAETAAKQGEADELRDRLKSHLQHYVEPPAPESSRQSSGATSSIGATYNGGPLLPLGPGILTLNRHGVPVFVVCTKADLMDAAGDELGLRGGAWEERTDWIQQVLRTLCLSYGASLSYTASTQPHTYNQLRAYLVHRLYTSTAPLHPVSAQLTTGAPLTNRFHFPHRANVFDRDAVLVPSGWDSWGKIKVLREGFDPEGIGKAWASSLDLTERAGEMPREGIEQIWDTMIPVTSQVAKPHDPYALTSTVEPEQAFLARQLEALQKDPQRDPRATFRNAAAITAASASASQGAPGSIAEGRKAGVLGPMGAGGLSLPGVDKAMAEMEGQSAESPRDEFARTGRKESGKSAATGNPGGTATNEQLHNFFQGLLATKGKTATTPKEPAHRSEA